MIRTLSLLFATIIAASASTLETNATTTHRIEIVLTVAGMQESAESIKATSQEIATLTEKLSNKQDFNDQDCKHITALAAALNNNADAINRIADTLPSQLDQLQGSAVNLLDHATQEAQKVVSTSKTDLVDPTLDRIQTQVIIFVLLLGGVLIAVIWFGLWQIRSIVATGSETIANVKETMDSLKKVVEKVNQNKTP